MKRIIALATALLCLFATPAAASDVPYAEVKGWTIVMPDDPKDTYCLAMAEFEGDTTVAFGYDVASERAIFFVTNPKWYSLAKKGEDAPIKIRWYYEWKETIQDSWTINATVTTDPKGFYFNSTDSELVTGWAAAHEVFMYTDTGKQIDHLNLVGTAASYLKVLECSAFRVRSA